MPHIKSKSGKYDRGKNDEIFKEIQNSYSKIGRNVYNASITEMGFDFTIMEARTGKHLALTEYVYKTIKEGLEEVFGKF